MSNLPAIEIALQNLRNARQTLRELNVMNHEKSVHCELAEWFVAEWTNGTRAKSGNQKGWDIELGNGEKVQVKAHAKAITNNSPWTTLSNHTDGVSEMMIIIFDIHYKIDEVFRIKIQDALMLCNKNREIQWSKLRKEGKEIGKKEFDEKFAFLFNTY